MKETLIRFDTATVEELLAHCDKMMAPLVRDYEAETFDADYVTSCIQDQRSIIHQLAGRIRQMPDTKASVR